MFALLALCLLQPTLVISRVARQQNFLGLLFDDSRSMTLAEDGVSRGDMVAEHFGAESELTGRLSERFSLRNFAFAAGSNRIASVEELTFDGTRTNISGALGSTAAELSGIPLAGLVVVSDGAANTSAPLAEALVPLQAAGVPVYTVGLGEEIMEPDIELGRVETPRSALVGSSLLVDVVITQRGFGRGTPVELIVEDDMRILAEKAVELGADGEPLVAQVSIRLDHPGPRVVHFRIPVRDGEDVTENNERSVHLDVRDEREKVLYFEGEPRFEVKFMRRAVADDDNIQLVVLQRTAESKFLRLDVDDASELEFGFPSERSELYRYRGLVLGSVEASFFTHDQLTMIADFVSERGGGLLMLGGSRAFAEGGWAGTPVEEVMPVVLGGEGSARASAAEGAGADPAGGDEAQDPGDADPDARIGFLRPNHDEQYFAEVKVAPTRAGLAHPAIRLDAEPNQVAELWAGLPSVTLVNPISETRPGATTLLSGPTTIMSGPGLAAAGGSGGAGPQQVVLAHQRYGRGKSIALTIQDSWLWQMHGDVSVDDQTHEMFWRQMIRWLVDGVPDPLQVVAARESTEPGEAVRLVATVQDSTYAAVNGASVTARVVAPSGEVTETPAEWTVERDGEYAFDVRTTELGEHAVRVVASRDGEELGGARTFVVSAPSVDEFFGAGQDAQALERISDATGGRHYTLDELSSLPEDIELSGGGVTLVERLDLWDMPAFFLAMVVLMATEWGWRRRRGLS